MKLKNKTILYIGNNLISKTKYQTTLETLSDLLIDEGYKVYKSSSRINKFLRLLDMIFSVVKYRKKIDFLLIDTYSTSNFYYALIVSQLAILFRIKYIPILHGGNLPDRLSRSKKLSDKIFNNSYKNIAPSNYLKVEFENKGYKVIFIPNVILLKKYDFKERKELKANLLYVRAFAKFYNPTMAIEVLKELKNTFNNAKLCMIGPDKDGTIEKIKQKIKEAGLINDVEITGVLTKKEWHKKSEDYDVFINTTNIDNTPISVIEAMALGLPVVSTNVGGIPYLIKNNDNGILVKPNDIDEMVNGIQKLILDNNFSTEIAKNARVKVEEFDWEVVKEKWFSVLK